MRERMGQILKLLCFALAAVLLYQLVQTARRVNPLAGVNIPALPRLASDTNAPATNAPAAGALASGPARGTNMAGTNVAAVKQPKEGGSNAVAVVLEKPGTNSAKPLGAPAPLPASHGHRRAPRGQALHGSG